MARKARLSGYNLYHHIYAWGNDRHPVFKKRMHYEKYLKYLEFYGDYYDIEIIAYALLKWHVHLFVFDVSKKISEFMNRLHGLYAQYFNKSTNRVGHVFGERFNNRIVQVNSYGLWLSRYIHRQPVEAGIVKDPKDYPWTSYRAYIGLAPFKFLKPSIILNQFGPEEQKFQRYKDFVMGKDDGPIKWDKKSVSIIGEEEFLENIGLLKENSKKIKFNYKDLVEDISKQLQITTAKLLNPKGWAQRRVRHRAFLILAKKYELSASDIGRIFKISPMAVIKVLNRNRTKV